LNYKKTGTSMDTRLYPLSGRDEDETKVCYPLDLGMRMMMNLFYGDEYEITKLVPFCPVVIPSKEFYWNQESFSSILSWLCDIFI